MALQDTQSVSTTYGDVSIPSESPGETPPAASQTSPDQSQPAEPWWKQHENAELELQAAGKTVKAPFSRVRQWAQQGYDYAQRMQAFNLEKSQWEAQQAELAKDSEWSDVVKFARENPEWAQHTRQSWEQREQWQQQAQTDPNMKPFMDEIQRLKSELATVKPVVTEFQAEQTRIRNEREDTALDQEVSAIKERYSKYGMDLTQIDQETGLTYESSVLKYGSENGIKSFKTAFLELYGEKIEGMREEALKKQAADDVAKRAKEGFIGRSPTPQGTAPKLDYRKMSHAQLAQEAHKAYSEGKYGK